MQVRYGGQFVEARRCARRLALLGSNGMAGTASLCGALSGVMLMRVCRRLALQLGARAPCAVQK